ncbi:MAG: flagellar export chaperone FlgN [Steroidobacteraceae bacterium]
MTPAMTVRCILAGMLGDVADYRRLRALLDAQFSAALRHRAEEISDIVGRIVELTAVLERRRRERVELAGALLAGKVPASRVSLQAVSERLPATARARFDDCCATLEALVTECKRLNRRNCNLLTAQHDIMHRVLKTEAYIYAPA